MKKTYGDTTLDEDLETAIALALSPLRLKGELQPFLFQN